MSDPRLRSNEWQALRRLILGRDHYRCQINGPLCRHTATEVDHILSPLEGGDFWDTTNLRGSCKPCNAGRGGVLARRRSFTYRKTEPWLETRL
jgi:5-methylcytosine-specific restriction protein A